FRPMIVPKLTPLQKGQKVFVGATRIGYCSSQVRERLERAGLRFITPARTNMKNRNTEEEKGLL
ncbi:MAG: transposase, partial [Puniceicoccales bacterium]|nr:transposase [Puniceicoccales bacterium]